MVNDLDPVVSFYMTVRNGLPFIADSIKSIKNQTYEDWECVVVDDGSTDGTSDWLKKLGENDSRFKVILTDGIGRGKALNMAVEASKGKYVANLDADDYAHPSRAALQVKLMEDNDFHFLATSSHVIYDDETPVWDEAKSLEMENLVSIDRRLLKNNPVNHSSVMMLRNVFIEVGEYDSTRKAHLDYELWIRMVVSGVCLMKSNIPLVAKRIHKKQSFENKTRLIYLFSSVLLQVQGIRSINGGWGYYLYAIARFLYGLLPQRVRVIRR